MSKSSFHNIRPHILPAFTNLPAGSSSNAPRKDPPFFRQSRHLERQIKDLINALEYSKRLLLGSILHKFLVTEKKVPNDNDYEFQSLLDIILTENDKDRTFLPHRLSKKQILKVKAARNDVDHHNWLAVQRKFVGYFNAMIALAVSLDHPDIANEIQTIRDRILKKDYTGGVTFKPFKIPNNGNFDLDAALGFSQITTRIFNEMIVPDTWESLDGNRRKGSPPPSMDLQANLSEMIQTVQTNPNFLPQGALRILRSVRATRLDVAHGHHENILKHFEVKYTDLIDYLRILGYRRHADIVRVIKEKLVALKKSGENVTSDLFPSLYTT
jgi:hypothetical protein